MRSPEKVGWGGGAGVGFRVDGVGFPASAEAQGLPGGSGELVTWP